MKCDCKAIGDHDVWCSAHPTNRLALALADENNMLKAKLELAVKALEQIAESGFCPYGHDSMAREALKEIRGEK